MIQYWQIYFATHKNKIKQHICMRYKNKLIEGSTEKINRTFSKQKYCKNNNGTTHFKNCKQLFEYKHLLLLSDIWWSKL
jgi:hypothetical protein